ncbi:hypothetical protein RYX36_004473, partial [Vicia faba]
MQWLLHNNKEITTLRDTLILLENMCDTPLNRLKLWRCKENQRKEASQLQIVNRKLAAMNKLLIEENERLQKQVSEL